MVLFQNEIVKIAISHKQIGKNITYITLKTHGNALPRVRPRGGRTGALRLPATSWARGRWPGGSCMAATWSVDTLPWVLSAIRVLFLPIRLRKCYFTISSHSVLAINDMSQPRPCLIYGWVHKAPVENCSWRATVWPGW